MKSISIERQNSIIYIGESYQNIQAYLPDKKCIIVCDKNIYKHYSSFVEQYPHIIIECGEENKNWKSVKKIIVQLLAFGADRNSFLIGMGGGLVCDVAGFAASVFMRGLEFGFISTSLLSQVDASVGGKNGINLGKLKNMIGVFNPPKFVICDPVLLKTLPVREVRSGFAEVIKHAIIKDKALFEFLRDNKEMLLKLDAGLLETLIYKAVSIKAEVVENDPFEKGQRKLLNFGHTIGHAIENNSDLTHGEAVAIGMMAATELSGLSESETDEIRLLLKDYDLPVQHKVSPRIIDKFLSKDKKKNNSSIDFVLLKKIGEAYIRSIEISDLKFQIKKD